MAFLYINKKKGKLHQSVFLVFTGGQEQFNILLNTCCISHGSLQVLVCISCSPLLQYSIHTDIFWAYGSLI